MADFHSDKVDMPKNMLKDFKFDISESGFLFRIEISRQYGVNNECPQSGDDRSPVIFFKIYTINTSVLNGANIQDYFLNTPKDKVRIKVYIKHLGSFEDLLKWFKEFKVDAFSVPDIDFNNLVGVYTETVEPND